MAHIVVLGAGLGGVPMALEMRQQARKEDTVTVISDQPVFSFTPSNPWVAVDWRKPDQIQVELEPVFKKKKIDFIHCRAKKVRPEQNAVELDDGRMIDYDYLVIATGPELAFDEIEGLGPHGGHTHSVCTTPHALEASKAWEDFVKDPGPIVVGAVQGASCFGPAYEYAFILDTDLRKRKIRDKVPMTFVTSEPYIGHLGLDGVGDTKGMLESELRERHIKFITSARIQKFLPDMVVVEEMDDDGSVKKVHELPQNFSMMLPAFRGIEAVRDIEGLVNPRGFVTVDEAQQNAAFPNIFSVGVCVAIPPVGQYAVPVGVPKTGFMIESMVRATAHNIRRLLDAKKPDAEATWNAVCIADFGDGGVAFVAMPQIPPRNVNWAASGKWVHWAKAAFEKYFVGKIRRGVSEPFYERVTLDLLGITKTKKEEKSQLSEG
ncbi:NAD(P)/FAD-dependent oxidoreductase [Parvularcula marina]|uniref:Sulfide-quinone reductase n=1 Tax=Parvularcula marina TaxID=2292771 RepID=A0A371REM4_9PROT|nr:FAD-dependent oxidoreductase [Parvularcula marina]RFB03907.1 NAD(P)/FAD-dependent oxidoreductase [Parvularcula marina]